MSLEVLGSTQVVGDASALFALAGEAGFTWELTADAAVLTRVVATWDKGVDNPKLSGEYAVRDVSDFTRQTERLTRLSLASTGVADDGALLALSENAILETISEGVVRVEPQLDPTIAQNPAAAEANGIERGDIEAHLLGDYLVVRSSDGEATIRGDITLLLYGPSYTLVSDEGASEERTGEYETARTAVVSEGRKERHEYALAGAVLTLRAPGGMEAYTQYPQITFSGDLRTTGAEGAIVLGPEEIAAPPDGALVWTGAATLSLTPRAGRLAAAPPTSALATTAIIVDSGPRVLLVSAALGVISLAATGAFVVARVRARRDDLTVAILAMEERRWSDALPPLARLARKEPTNAKILVDRALCLEQAGRVEEAAKAFETALRAAPRHAEAHFYYARTLARMRENEAARVHLETALEHDPRLVELARRERVLRGL